MSTAPTSPDRLMSLKEVEDFTGLSKNTVRTLLRSADAPCVCRLGPRSTRVRMSDLLEFLKNRSGR